MQRRAPPTIDSQLTWRSRPSQCCSRSLNFWIFPVAVRGIESRNSTLVGALYPAIRSLQCATISDRKKDVIITGGENVSSIEVEDCLFSHPAVAEVAVIGVPDEKWGETIKALVVLRPGATATERDLIEHCRERLAHYKCPRSVDVVEALPRNATGKILKRSLREPYWRVQDRYV